MAGPSCNAPEGASGSLSGSRGAVTVIDGELAADTRSRVFEDYRVRLARAGHSLYELSDGSYLVSMAACCRPLADLRAVAVFARKVGCSHG